MARKNTLLLFALFLPLTFSALTALNGCGKEEDTPVDFSIDLTNPLYGSLNTVGGNTVVEGIFIMRTGVASYIALSQACTQGDQCTVTFNSSSNRFICPCCSSIFDINGNVVSGAARSALTKYTVGSPGTELEFAL